MCENNTPGVASVSFNIGNPPTPTLQPHGNTFCAEELATISDLTANTNSTTTVLWYDAPTGGTVYNSSELLQNNTTYYAASQNASGCESNSRLAVTVTLNSCWMIVIPDGISPNNDGTNDQLTIENLEFYPEHQIEIFNRYGTIVYKGDINTPLFNGNANQATLGGDKLPEGVYYIVVDLNHELYPEPLQSHFYLSR